MHKHLLHVLAADVRVLDLLRHDVLALAQLEDVLLAVDHLERAVRLPLANVAGVVPAVLVDRLRRPDRVLVVAVEERKAM